MQVSRLSGSGRPEYRKPALVVAHPGHELKVFGWLCQSGPRIYILTNGSGGAASRLSSTERVLQGSSATLGEIFGQFSDAEIYQVILTEKTATLLQMVDRLAASFVQHGIDFVAGDATEGFNPTHDICRALVNAAVAVAEQATNRPIANYEFCLTEWEQHCREVHDYRCWHVHLEDALLHKKLKAAQDYTELRGEIQQAIASKGKEYFRMECLKKVIQPFPELVALSKPYYETFGEKRVAEGKYASVIRYDQHMLPILKAIQAHAKRRALERPMVSTAAVGRL